MSLPVLTSNGSAHKARVKNENLQTRVLEPTDENRKLVREYEALAKEINLIPLRIAGLRRNYRKRDIPQRIAELMTERDEKMARLIEMEKTLFPKTGK